MTLTMIKASGNAYDMGREIGQAMAKTVHAVAVHNEELVAIEQNWSGSHYLDQLIAAARQVFPHYVRELEGMADGMDITFARAFLWNCRGDLPWPKDISPAIAAGLSEGCTTLMIPPEGDKPAMIAHNEDGSEDYHGHCFWVSARPDVGPEFESFLYPGMIPGHTLAANAAGVVQTINNIRVDDLQPGLPRHFICRAVLACQTPNDALELLKRTDRASGFHHNLGFAGDGRMVSVEAPASGCISQDISKMPYAHANHLISPTLKNKAQTITRSSAVRQDRADALLATDVLTESGPTGILFEAKRGHEILRSPVDGGDDYGKTLATGLFEMTTHSVNITIHDGPDNLNIHSTVLEI